MFSLVELIATIFTLISVILTVRSNRYCWLFGIVGIIFYGILFYKNQIWGNVGLQFLFLTQSIIGWYKWGDVEIKTNWLKSKHNWYVINLSFIIFYLVYKLTSGFGGNNIEFDSITTTLSIVGTILLAYKKINAWFYWIIADIFFIAFFYSIGMYLSAILYFVFLALAVNGLIEWIKLKKNEKI